MMAENADTPGGEAHVHATPVREGKRSLVKGMERRLSPRSVIVIYRYVSTIFKSATRDRRIALSPCDGIRLPKDIGAAVVPMSTAEVQALAKAIPDRYAAMVVLAAGTGLRQGEVFGLTLDRVDFLRRTLIVDPQLVGLQGQAPKFGPPKTASSIRTVPLPTRRRRPCRTGCRRPRGPHRTRPPVPTHRRPADLHRHRGSAPAPLRVRQRLASSREGRRRP